MEIASEIIALVTGIVVLLRYRVVGDRAHALMERFRGSYPTLEQTMDPRLADTLWRAGAVGAGLILILVGAMGLWQSLR